MKRNLKYFWSFVKKTRSDTSIASYMQLGDEEASDGGRIAQLFSTHFKSVYKSSTYTSLPLNNLPTITDNLVITTSLLEASLAHLKDDNHSGPDGIPSLFVKKCSASLLDPLLLLFNKSLSCGIFPSKWKDSYIFPKNKSGNKHEVSNYRPISILSNCIQDI